MRESGVWTYALVNLTHLLGVATLFGSILVLDLRLLGVGRRTTIAAVMGATSPVAAAGFAVAALSGLGLLASNATEYRDNPFLLIKFPAIALGVINAVIARRAASPSPWMGGVSLACWLTAVAAGRLIGYW